MRLSKRRGPLHWTFVAGRTTKGESRSRKHATQATRKVCVPPVCGNNRLTDRRCFSPARAAAVGESVELASKGIRNGRARRRFGARIDR
jgi:hypothetical protein